MFVFRDYIDLFDFKKVFMFRKRLFKALSFFVVIGGKPALDSYRTIEVSKADLILFLPSLSRPKILPAALPLTIM